MVNVPFDVLSAIIPDCRMRLLSKDLRDRHDDEASSFFCIGSGDCPNKKLANLVATDTVTMTNRFPLSVFERYGVLDRLVSLTAESLVLKDLTPLTKCTALTSLSVYDNKLTTLNGISKLQHLKKLCIVMNDIRDISELKSCTALEKLSISRMSINHNLSECVPALKSLVIHNSVFDRCSLTTDQIVQAVSMFKDLECLKISRSTPVSSDSPDDLSPLSHLPLRVLDITGTTANTMPPFPLLTDLALPATFSDVEILIQCTGLKKLRISGFICEAPSKRAYYKISSRIAEHCMDMLGPISAGLEELNISINDLKNLKFLRSMPNLRVINLDRCTISDESFEPLTLCKKLGVKINYLTSPELIQSLFVNRINFPLCDEHDFVLSAKHGRSDIVELLLNAPGQTVPASGMGLALVCAAAHGHIDIVRLLTSDKNAIDHNNMALRSAAAQGHADIVEILLRVGPDVSIDTIKEAMRDARKHLNVRRVLSEHAKQLR